MGILEELHQSQVENQRLRFELGGCKPSNIGIMESTPQTMDWGLDSLQSMQQLACIIRPEKGHGGTHTICTAYDNDQEWMLKYFIDSRISVGLPHKQTMLIHMHEMLVRKVYNSKPISVGG